MKKTEKTIVPIPSKGIIRDLIAAKSTVAKLCNQGKPYDALITEITNVGDNGPYPSSKKLQDKLDIKPAHFKKLLDTLYEDFLNSIHLNPDFLELKSVEYYITVKGSRDYAAFSCRLPFTPKVGEGMRIPFIRGTAGTDHFYVDRVDYDFINNGIIINIHLQPGFYNQHYEYSKDRALLEGHLGFMDIFDMPTYAIEDLIKRVYR